MTTAHRDRIVIGASAGGLPALMELLRDLPAEFPAAIFIVLHTSPDNPGVLPRILLRSTRMATAMAIDREAIVSGRIYVAPPDHHLLVRRSYVQVTRGPKENGFRPAVDPLFRTAARAYGPRVIGVVLSGGLNDGTHGLGIIVQHGGLAVIQDPQDALVPSMPLSALRNVEVHHVVPSAELGPTLERLVHETIVVTNAPQKDSFDTAEAGSSLERREPPGKNSPYTCPDCGGALWETSSSGTLLRYSCHVGHAYTAEALIAGQEHQLEDAMWAALRALEENADLSRRMAERMQAAGIEALTRRYLDNANDAERRAATIREVLNRGVSLHHNPQAVDAESAQATRAADTEQATRDADTEQATSDAEPTPSDADAEPTRDPDTER